MNTNPSRVPSTYWESFFARHMH